MLEYGEYKGYLYGTSIDAVRTVLDAGKICVIDLEPQVSGKGAGNLLEGKIIFSTLLSCFTVLVALSCFSLYLMVLINNRLLFLSVLGGGGGTTVTSMLRQCIFYQASSCILSVWMVWK